MNGAGHLAQLVLHLGTGFRIDEFRDLIREISIANPILRAPILRRALLGPPEYRLDRAHTTDDIPVDAIRLDTRSTLHPPSAFLSRLNATFSPRKGRLLTFDVTTYKDGTTDLAMTWLHPLLDGWGSERFIEHLARCANDPKRDRTLTIDASAATLPKRKDGKSHTMRERGEMAQAWLNALRGTDRHTISSPAGPLRRVQQRLDYRWSELSMDDTAQIVARSEKMAGVLTPMLFYLAAAVRGHQAVAKHRGEMPENWTVPLPVNLRSKSAPDETFRTLVSLIWFHATPVQAEDFAGLLEVLALQRRNAIRDGMIRNGIAAMEFAGIVPAHLFTKLARGVFRGELCSFFFAFTGEFAPAADSLCGARIENGSHAPSVPPSPGSSIMVSLRRGRLTLTQIRQRGALSDGEMQIMRESILADLLGR
jgi:hypothetical protein